MPSENVLVVGHGEIGEPLAKLLGANYRVFTKDVEPIEIYETIEVMHVCYPFQVEDFVGTTVDYIAEFQPSLTIIHSTVLPGTTTAVHKRSHEQVAYSPVRGKHAAMSAHMLHYTTFVGGVTLGATQMALEHLEGAGLRVESFSSPEALELSKLLETTYFGLLIAWAQEQERYGRELGVDYDEMIRIYKDVEYLPPVEFQPGFIGGHCVMPNIELLEKVRTSPFLDAIKHSNDEKSEEWLRMGRKLEERLVPRKL